MGINLGKVISDVNTATKGFAGMQVPVEIDVDPKTKTFTVKVFSPSVASLLKKELSLEKGSGEALKTKVGNIAFERVVFVAQTKMPSLLAKDLKSAVKLVAGTAVSLGLLIDNKDPKDVEREIEEGKYDKEIKNEITEVSEVKKKDLSTFFAVVKAKQEKEKKALEEAKAAAEAAKAAADAAAPAAAAPAADAKAAPAADAKGAAKAPAAKAPAKK
jgi:large subunit ribosomal protein L11